jgi:DNA invertase Pin-like site-specific DNA recombinase
MLHLYAALAEKERKMISERTKAALAVNKAEGCSSAIGQSGRSPRQRRRIEPGGSRRVRSKGSPYYRAGVGERGD